LKKDAIKNILDFEKQCISNCLKVRSKVKAKSLETTHALLEEERSNGGDHFQVRKMCGGELTSYVRHCPKFGSKRMHPPPKTVLF